MTKINQTKEYCHALAARALKTGLHYSHISKILRASGDNTAVRTVISQILLGERITGRKTQRRIRQIEFIISEYERTEERITAVLREEQTRR